MKKALIIFILIITSVLQVYAENIQTETYKLQGQINYDDNPIDVIYLEDVDKPRVNIPQRSLTLPVGVLNITSNTNTSRSALAKAMINRNTLTDILPLSASVSENIGHGFSCGSTWGQEISYTQMEATTSMFIKYDTPKKFSLVTSFRETLNPDIDKQYSSIRVTPEWHITDKLTLKNSLTNYVNTQKNKNELTLVYSPQFKKHVEALKFELGIAQSFYANGNQGSAINFSTGFKL